MSWAGTRVGIGTRVTLDGEINEIIEWLPGAKVTEVVLKNATSVCRMSLVALLSEERVQILTEDPGPEPDDAAAPAAITLLGLSAEKIKLVRDRAGHVRELLTGFRSGSTEFALPGEPRPQYDPSVPVTRRYAAKAAELGNNERTVRRWVKQYREAGEAGLVSDLRPRSSRVDQRWTETAAQIMVEYTNESKPSKAAVIFQTSKRLERYFGPGAVEEPKRTTAYRELEWLEHQHRIFGGTTKRNRDIAKRPKRPYGKLRPGRPGEYVILDTTPLDVFALDPKTLQWVRVELTVAMDWYTRCVIAVRLTPTSTKAVDVAAVMYQIMRPAPAGKDWPPYAVWPQHGMPREILIDPDQYDRTGGPGATPTISPEAIVVDHGKIYVSEHVNSVCQRLGISIQPARIREGRDKGPLERFFRTLRESLLQYLPGYKGPDINARGLDVEGHAFFYIDQLEAIIREWVATVYHHRKHDSLRDPGMPKSGTTITPAQMFAHGIARAGYLEVPRDPQLAYEFLKVETRTIQHYGIQRGRLKYKAASDDNILVQLSAMRSPYPGMDQYHWPIHVDPDDVTRIYIRHPETRHWHELRWEQATEFPMPFSDEGLRYFRRIIRDEKGFIDDRLALDAMLTRWNLGMGRSVAERRIALRMSRADSALSHQVVVDDATLVESLPSVQDTISPPAHASDSTTRHNREGEHGDDDRDDDLAADYDIDELEWS
ncbi:MULTISPECIES: helix-turn-helix domain-containing protein [Mycobacterium avium complex (MAC)]|uniref:helix-turn-helix domain-containing protein n=1 Tax=Mycobacterium avium complex (MAC) TaxID=120793 RepID=UPI000566DCB0|nr:helix-turn-helix domain-containing protein [Mycobacterium intracellulare]MCA2275246.1 DDE-type integrase/transposase/recombinase [Mycobacterium intracellulare]UEB24857.1 helix-turn-helix domain-containing protein [Mycobacterium intracellulare]